jgi:hypothetical protein
MQGQILKTMKVSRAIVMTNSAPFMAMLNPMGKWAESGATTVDLEDEHVVAVELWMRQFHDALVPGSNTIKIVDVWHVIETSCIYLFNLEQLNPWFALWINHNGVPKLQNFNVAELKQPLYPIHEFDHAQAFAHVTRRLVYETRGKIYEKNLTNFNHLHFHQRIIGRSHWLRALIQANGSIGSGLNAARGNLKFKIHKKIYIQEDFLRSGCSCRKDGLFAYELALSKTGVWPIENVLNGKEN